MKNISVGTHKLKLDFANGASGVLFSTQADSGRTFEVQVLDEENNVQDITGLTLDFFVGTAKEVTKVSATIKDAVNGIFEINAVSSQFKYAGVHKAQFVLRDSTGAKIGTQIYNIHVEESIENGATVGENVIVSFEAVSEAAELLRNSGAVLEESKEVSATLKTDIAKAETIDTTLKTTTKTAEDTNTKAQTTNATLTKTIETANTANANTTNTLKQLTAENDEATLNITALDEKNKLATTNIADLASSTNTANTSNTNLKATITNAETAEQKLKTEIVNAGLENYITLEDIRNKADLGADGKVNPEQLPTTEVYFRDARIVNGFIKFKLNVPIQAMFGLDINVLDWYHHYRIRVTGYNYAVDKKWYSPKVSLLESNLDDVKVILGYDGPNELWIALERTGYFGATINNLLLSYGPEYYDISEIEMVHENELTGNVQVDSRISKLARIDQLPTKEQIDAWNFKENDITNPTELAENTDLNKVLDPGYYFARDNNIAKAILNSPVQYAFSLRVYKTNMNSVVQELKEYVNWEGSKTYIRECSNIGKFSEWREILTAYNIANDLNTSSAYKVLGASQGKVIWDHIVANQANWNKDTTYSVATTTANGLMTSTDKIKLDNLKEHVILTQSAYDSLSDVQKNDATKIYLVGA